MRTKRIAPAAACLNGRVYVAGGYDGKKYLTTMEYYDADADNWVEVASMKIARNCTQSRRIRLHLIRHWWMERRDRLQ